MTCLLMDNKLEHELGNSVSRVPEYELGDRGSIPAGIKNLLSSLCVQTDLS